MCIYGHTHTDTARHNTTQLTQNHTTHIYSTQMYTYTTQLYKTYSTHVYVHNTQVHNNRVHLRTHARTHAHPHARTHTHAHARSRACTHARTQTHTRFKNWIVTHWGTVGCYSHVTVCVPHCNFCRCIVVLDCCKSGFVFGSHLRMSCCTRNSLKMLWSHHQLSEHRSKNESTWPKTIFEKHT